MKVEKVFKDPLSRQAGEAVMIRRTKGNVLNSKLEFNQPQLFNVRREIMNGWETAQKPDVFLMNVYMYRRSEHQSSNLKSNSYQLVTWRGRQAKDLVKKFKLFAIKALEINYQVTTNQKHLAMLQYQSGFTKKFFIHPLLFFFIYSLQIWYLCDAEFVNFPEMINFKWSHHTSYRKLEGSHW